LLAELIRKCALNISTALKTLQENGSLKEKHHKQTTLYIKLVIYAEHPPNLISFQHERRVDSYNLL